MSGRVINDLDIINSVFAKMAAACGASCTLSVQEILRDLNRTNGVRCIYAPKDPRGSQQIRQTLLSMGFSYIPAEGHGTGKYRLEGFKLRIPLCAGVGAAC